MKCGTGLSVGFAITLLLLAGTAVSQEVTPPERGYRDGDQGPSGSK